MSTIQYIDDLLNRFAGNECQKCQIILPTCFLIKDLLTITEQIDLYKAIMKSSQISGKYLNKLNKNKNNNNLININVKNKNHEKQLSKTYFDIIKKTVSFINDNLHSKNKNINFPKGNNYKFNNFKAKQYSVPNGNIFNHCDTQKGWVLLFSIGCTPNFYVQHKQYTPKEWLLLKDDIKVDFTSGSVIVFDSSKQAGIFHRIDSIENDTCPIQVEQKCPKLKINRIGLQVRLRGFSTVPNKQNRKQLH